MILYRKSNLVYIVVFSQFLIFQKNNSAETQTKLTLTSRHYYFVEKLKIVEKQLCKLNCSYGKISHAFKGFQGILKDLKRFHLTNFQGIYIKKINEISHDLKEFPNIFVDYSTNN